MNGDTNSFEWRRCITTMQIVFEAVFFPLLVSTLQKNWSTKFYISINTLTLSVLILCLCTIVYGIHFSLVSASLQHRQVIEMFKCFELISHYIRFCFFFVFQNIFRSQKYVDNTILSTIERRWRWLCYNCWLFMVLYVVQYNV